MHLLLMANVIYCVDTHGIINLIVHAVVYILIPVGYLVILLVFIEIILFYLGY